MYPLIKYIHVTTVALSLAGFLLRALWRWRAPERLRDPLVRILPHVNDTVLLGSGLVMLWLFRWSPLDQPWIAAKLFALVGYVVLGSVSLRGSTRGRRTLALAAAVAVFSYIVAVALTKQIRTVF